jgi:hypothetical protein
MTLRTRRETMTFRNAFSLDSVEGKIPAGVYEIVTDEESIDGLSFVCFRRVATMMTIPAQGGRRETIVIDPRELAKARLADDQVVR